MKRCDRMVDIGRRQFLKGSVAAASGAAALGLFAERAGAATTADSAKYPSNRLANVNDLKVNDPLEVSYPDEDAPGVLLKLGQPVEGGAGPEGDIVGFTTVCPHKGYPLVYGAADMTFSATTRAIER